MGEDCAKTDMKATFSLLLVTSFLCLAHAFTRPQINEMLYWHNYARAEVSTLGICSNMLEMFWDQTIEEVASPFVDACTNVRNGHNPNRHTQYREIAPPRGIRKNCLLPTYCLGEIGHKDQETASQEDCVPTLASVRLPLTNARAQPFAPTKPALSGNLFIKTGI